jgi:hypothetical protein
VAGAAVKLPGVGEVPRAYVAVGGAAVVGAVGFAYLRRGAGGSADPSAEVAAADPTGTTGDYAAGVDAYANPAPAGSTTAASPAEVDPDTLPPTTNAAWTSRAVERLADVGYDPQAIAAACGRYLGRQPLASAAEVEIVRTALAMVGPPPLGDYSLIGPTPATTSTPAPPSSAALKAPSGLKVSKVTKSSVYIDWAKVPGARTYLITSSTHGLGTSTRTVTASGGYVTGLKPGTPYRFNVRAVDAKGINGPASGSVSATTKRK